MYQFIVNPGAGAGRGYRIWKRLERRLENDSQEYRVFFTERQGDAMKTAQLLTSDKREPQTIVIVGGEGTFNEILNGISFHCEVTLGYVPAGFRNALSKGFQSFRRVDRQVRSILNPKAYKLMDYGVVTCGDDAIFNRRFAGRCGIGLDAAICHNLLCCPARGRMGRFHMTRLLYFFLGLKQLMLAKPVKGALVLDGGRKVEFNHIYFLSFNIHRGEEEKKRGPECAEGDDGRMTVYVGNSAKKRKMIPILLDVIMGIKKKERGVRIFECTEAAVQLSRPLPVHVDGESCLCQQDVTIRCIEKKMKMIGS